MWRTSHRFRPTFLRTGHLVPLYSWANIPPRAAQRISNRWNDDKDVLRFVFVCQTDLRAIDRLGVVTFVWDRRSYFVSTSRVGTPEADSCAFFFFDCA